jgi:hypothetical protein
MWTVSCPACSIIVGAVEAGRFVHDPGCTRPLAIGTGQLRCCRCGGRLTGQEHPAVAAMVEEPATASLLHFLRPSERAEGLRQQL